MYFIYLLVFCVIGLNLTSDSYTKCNFYWTGVTLIGILYLTLIMGTFEGNVRPFKYVCFNITMYVAEIVFLPSNLI